MQRTSLLHVFAAFDDRKVKVGLICTTTGVLHDKTIATRGFWWPWRLATCWDRSVLPEILAELHSAPSHLEVREVIFSKRGNLFWLPLERHLWAIDHSPSNLFLFFTAPECFTWNMAESDNFTQTKPTPAYSIGCCGWFHRISANASPFSSLHILLVEKLKTNQRFPIRRIRRPCWGSIPSAVQVNPTPILHPFDVVSILRYYIRPVWRTVMYFFVVISKVVSSKNALKTKSH